MFNSTSQSKQKPRKAEKGARDSFLFTFVWFHSASYIPSELAKNWELSLYQQAKCQASGMQVGVLVDQDIGSEMIMGASVAGR